MGPRCPDLPEQLQNCVDYGSWRGDQNPQNVAALVKRYISDGELSQRPLLVLPHSRALKVENMVPIEKCLDICLAIFDPDV